jgi:hypothetical protein
MTQHSRSEQHQDVLGQFVRNQVPALLVAIVAKQPAS